jgi:hypothetical protein
VSHQDPASSPLRCVRDEFFAPAFTRALAQIACVPAERIDLGRGGGGGGASGGSGGRGGGGGSATATVLVRWCDAATPADRNLVASVMPVVPESLVPPQVTLV